MLILLIRLRAATLTEFLALQRSCLKIAEERETQSQSSSTKPCH